MIYATPPAVGCFNNEGNKVSIKLMLATKLDSMSSSAKQPQSNDNNFLDALNNTKNTYPTKETPQQPIKDKQPTQHDDIKNVATKEDTEQSSSPIHSVSLSLHKIHFFRVFHGSSSVFAVSRLLLL